MGVIRGCEMTLGYIAHSVFRFCQLVLALTVCGLYGVDLHRANREHKYSDGKWVYAEVTASLSAVTALLYLIPFVARVPLLFVWDLILFILWIALFGVFGKMYIGTRADDFGIQRMKNAVWVDLVNALLWLISACGMLVYWIKHRNNRTRFTGRATV
ncbi:hypothetical protein D0Z07_9075 [Hyphodiscus hymeniophilus]|uniref:MARVEL domain-containing protein n=1 Tax=Hyphodiscus hymeniophilus TaxID=353542 RepID=A0A9P6SJJ8_9HELO|nr:hypothetical protein D0Z07_9075 [Hyphodiscus hymeniophilus]